MQNFCKMLPKILNANHKAVRVEISDMLFDHFAAKGDLFLLHMWWIVGRPLYSWYKEVKYGVACKEETTPLKAKTHLSVLAKFSPLSFGMLKVLCILFFLLEKE